MKNLPTWAQEIEPLDHTQAAYVLGVSERKLYTITDSHPYYERRGKGRRYYPEHIKELRTVSAVPISSSKVSEPEGQRPDVVHSTLSAQAQRNKKRAQKGY